MRIAQALLTPLRLELHSPLRTSRGTYAAREGFLVRLVDEDGREGLGEAMPLPEFGTEPLSTCGEALGAWLSSLRGQPVGGSLSDIEALQGKDSTPAAAHGLELALLDLLAQRQGVPLCRLLTEAPRPEVRVNALLGASEPGALAEEARRAAAEGFETLKLKVAGRPLEEDVRRVAAVREAVGAGMKLRLDANGGWSESEALHALERLGGYGLELVEQPTPPEDLPALDRVQRRAPCLIGADEALGSPRTLHALLSMDPPPALGAVVLKPMVLGGLLPSLKVARWAAERGMEAFVTSSLDGVVARAGAAHLAAALPSGALASGLAVGRLFVREPPSHPYQPVHGRIRLRETPGLGLTFDEVRE